MITIYCKPDAKDFIQQSINLEDRLSELVDIKDQDLAPKYLNYNEIYINHSDFGISLDWCNYLVPYLFPNDILLKSDNLLAFIYFLLGNFEKTYSLLESQPRLLQEIESFMKIKNGIEINERDLCIDSLSEYDDYRLMHNSAICLYYTSDNLDFDKINYFFSEAINLAPNNELEVFSAKFYLSFLMDFGKIEQVKDLLKHNKALVAKHEIALNELKALENKIWMQELVVPYDQELLSKLKDQLWSVLQAYENQNRLIEVGMLLEDASYVANISESFTESLGYISRAIDIFKNENLSDLYYQAEWKKGNLLFTWAKKNQPQFFNAAIQSYKTAMLYFKKIDFPEIHAEIQHHLGIIYSEIPCDADKKAIWAAFSVSAFQEALEIFKKDSFPYDYAAVCNSFANALIIYPEAKKSDNIDKAFHYYREALDIRNADEYPMERAITLLNYIECCWHANAAEKHHNAIRVQDMISKANQVLRLTNHQDFIDQANTHLEKIEELRSILEN